MAHLLTDLMFFTTADLSLDGSAVALIRIPTVGRRSVSVKC